jgi:hypothetical protein
VCPQLPLRWSQAACAQAQRAALQRYLTQLPAHYPAATHRSHLKRALAVFHQLARGAAVAAAAEQVRRGREWGDANKRRGEVVGNRGGCGTSCAVCGMLSLANVSWRPGARTVLSLEDSTVADPPRPPRTAVTCSESERRLPTAGARRGGGGGAGASSGWVESQRQANRGLGLTPWPRAHAHSSVAMWVALSSLHPLRRGVKLGCRACSRL